MTTLRNCILALVLAGLLQIGDGLQGALRAENPRPGYILEKVRAHLNNKNALPLDIRNKAEKLDRYYKRETARMLWLEPARADELIAAISGLNAAGVAKMDGSIDRLETRKQALRSSDASFLALVELTFSAHYLAAVETLFLGRTELYSDSLHKRTLERFIYPEQALELAESRSIAEVLAGLEPRQPDYQAIRAKLVEYVSLRKTGGWLPLKAGPDLRKGDTGTRVADLRARLMASGYVDASAHPDVFDPALAEAVRQFQVEHNLPQSGIADRRTVLALNIPVQDRIVQLTANLERWRWFEDFSEDKLVVVNVNRNRLELRQKSKATKFFVIQSDPACEQYPAFNSTIDHVELNPSFTFPRQLTGRYFLPVLQKKPTELDRSIIIHAEATHSGLQSVDWKTYSEDSFPFTVEQPPGASNLLGSFQLLLKDDSEVSIHGHPAPEPKLPIPRKLWPACIALQGAPENASQFLLDLGAQERDANTEEGAKNKRIELTQPVPVVFLYATMWLDEAGTLIFGPDPLGLDAILARKLIDHSGS